MAAKVDIPTRSRETLLEFNNLSRRYGANWALSDAGGSFAAGEIVALEGENGSGKSTLLLTLAGILKPHRGEVRFAKDAQVHLVAHHPMAYTALSIERNLGLAAAIDNRAAPDIETALAYWEIQGLRRNTLATLSRGQMQRFLLARAMLCQQRVLLLDEPFTGLDAKGEETLSQFMAESARGGAAVVFSDHDAARARKLATRFMRMTAGRCVV